MNLKKVSELLEEGKSVDDLIQFVKKEDLKTSEYDLSQGWFNGYGYRLMAQDKMEDALKILKLNTELFPDGYNTWDSLGECLLQMGKKEEGIIAYKKSIALNPENKHAVKVLEDLK